MSSHGRFLQRIPTGDFSPQRWTASASWTDYERNAWTVQTLSSGAIPPQALENRTLDSKREMDIMNALDEMQSLKQRQERVDGGALLAALKRSAEEDGLEGGLDDDDEAAVRARSYSGAFSVPRARVLCPAKLVVARRGKGRRGAQCLQGKVLLGSPGRGFCKC